MDLYKQSERKFRLEIEGLRAVAALLVAVYHIWFGTVSGGVDVFFVVSGFLITTSLINMYERTGKVDAIGYVLKLGKRLFPAAFTVLLFVIAASYLYLPQSQWIETIKQIVASLLYVENWQLARNSVDYLAQTNAASPVQHFWAMSTQFQFYIIWTIVLIFTVFITKKMKLKLRNVLLVILLILFILSFSYSTYITFINQPWAYFDTLARVWEFAAGGLLSLLIVQLRFNNGLSFILGWIGLFGLISCGLLLDVSTLFPGYIALWPIISAILIIVAGNSGGKYSVYRILSSKPLVKFGSISYGFYLWHWPILIIYYNMTGNESVSFIHGVSIIIISIVMSYLTTYIIEKPVRNKKVVSKPKLIGLLTIIALPVIIATGAWTLYIKDVQASIVSSETMNLDSYPGANVIIHDRNVDEEIDFIPQVIQAGNDLPQSYAENCHQNVGEKEVIICEYGEIDNSKGTIALVGGSHSAHWLPALEIYANNNDMTILNITKSGCRFSTSEKPSSSEIDQEACRDWNNNVMDKLIELNPDLVFTTADASEIKGIPEGYIETWKKLEKHNINILAIKDNPRADFDIPTCIDINNRNSKECYIVNDMENLSDNVENLS